MQQVLTITKRKLQSQLRKEFFNVPRNVRILTILESKKSIPPNFLISEKKEKKNSKLSKASKFCILKRDESLYNFLSPTYVRNRRVYI